MSENTVRKYVGLLEEKSFITTEATSVFTKDGMKRNGNLLYTILPIQGAIDAYYRRQLERMDEEQQKQRTAVLMEKLNVTCRRASITAPVPPVSRCVRLSKKGKENTHSNGFRRALTACTGKRMSANRSPVHAQRQWVRWEDAEQRNEQFLPLWSKNKPQNTRENAKQDKVLPSSWLDFPTCPQCGQGFTEDATGVKQAHKIKV